MPAREWRWSAVGSTAEQLWSTEAVPIDEQFALWREVVREAFVPVSLTRSEPGPCPSQVSSRRIGAISVSRIASISQVVSRTEPDIAFDPGGVFFLNMPLTAPASCAQGSRRAGLEPGDFALIDGARPFELAFPGPFEQISLTIPHEALMPLLAMPLEATGVRVPARHGVGAVAAAVITTIAAQPGDLHAPRGASAHRPCRRSGRACARRRRRAAALGRPRAPGPRRPG